MINSTRRGLGTVKVGGAVRARAPIALPGGYAVSRPGSSRRGFTLIELLVVIAVIAILAGLVFPVTKAVNRTKLRTRVKGELAQLELAIQNYKSKLGVYPPDNPNNPLINQLYYELVGTVMTNISGGTYYRTLDGASELSATPATFQTYFGTGVSGLVNTAKPGGGDEAQGGYNCLPGLSGSQIAVLPSAARVLVSSIKWPENLAWQPVPTVKGMNPWRYNSSNPTNNPGSFDLWVDIMVDGKTNRISNWSREPLINP